MKHKFYHALVVGVAILSFTLPGCSGGTQNPVVPVTGKIALANGKKLPVGTRLLFNPVQGRVGSAVGAVADDGSFQVTHVSGADGAEEGKYTVQLLPPETDASEFTKIVPASYRDGAALFAEVKAGMAPLDFKVPAGR